MKSIIKLFTLLIAVMALASSCSSQYVEVKEIESEEFVENFDAETYIEEAEVPVIIEKLEPFATAFYNLFKGVANIGWWSLAIVACAILLSAAIIWLLRRVDRSYDKAWMYYLLYFVALIPAIGVAFAGAEFERLSGNELSTFHSIVLFMMALVPCVLMIFGGWGIRQCGMSYGMFHKNFNRHVGQMLMFPVWLFLIYLFWNAAFVPLIDMSESFTFHGGGFWFFVLTFVIGFAIVYCVYFVWFFLVSLLFETAGNNVVKIMSVVLWWVLVKVGYNWIYANFFGFGYFVILCLGALLMLAFLGEFLGVVNSMRCPMCHCCDAVETRKTDHGIEYRTTTGWRSMGSGGVPDSYNKEITNARKLVRTTVALHSWTTEHTCPYCGCKWDINHQEEVGRKEEVLRKRWTEVDLS